jgi:hypothetical protein
MADTKMLTVSPFRLGEQPNIRLGVAMITSAPEAITLHEKAVNEMWRGAIKGPAAAAHLRGLLLPSTDLERTGLPSNEVPGPTSPAVFHDGASEKVARRIASKRRGSGAAAERPPRIK